MNEYESGLHSFWSLEEASGDSLKSNNEGFYLGNLRPYTEFADR